MASIVSVYKLVFALTVIRKYPKPSRRDLLNMDRSYSH